MYVGIVQHVQIQVKEGLLREYAEEYADKGESFPCEKSLDVDGRVKRHRLLAFSGFILY